MNSSFRTLRPSLLLSLWLLLFVFSWPSSAESTFQPSSPRAKGMTVVDLQAWLEQRNPTVPKVMEKIFHTDNKSLEVRMVAILHIQNVYKKDPNGKQASGALDAILRIHNHLTHDYAELILIRNFLAEIQYTYEVPVPDWFVSSERNCPRLLRGNSKQGPVSFDDFISSF